MQIYFILFICFLISSCTEISNGLKEKMSGLQKPAPIDTILFSQATQIQFKDTFIDLGKVKEGTETKVIYTYKNIGDKPLMLFNVSPSCGCTIADYSHHPLSPMSTDSIIAKFDSKGKDGSYQKSIKVNCNTEQKVHDLVFRVNVTK